MPRPIKNEREMEPKEFSNDLKIKLMKGTISNILYIKKCINKGEYLETKSIVSNPKNKCGGHSPELPFGIFYFCSYIGIETMKIVSFMVGTNE